MSDTSPAEHRDYAMGSVFLFPLLGGGGGSSRGGDRVTLTISSRYPSRARPTQSKRRKGIKKKKKKARLHPPAWGWGRVHKTRRFARVPPKHRRWKGSNIRTHRKKAKKGKKNKKGGGGTQTHPNAETGRWDPSGRKRKRRNCVYNDTYWCYLAPDLAKLAPRFAFQGGRL